jgi:hypothetical protein
MGAGVESKIGGRVRVQSVHTTGRRKRVQLTVRWQPPCNRPCRPQLGRRFGSTMVARRAGGTDIKMRLRRSALLVLCACALALPASAANRCRQSPKLVGACFVVHGRLFVSDGTPDLRMWKIGTHRILGIVDPVGEPRSCRSRRPFTQRGQGREPGLPSAARPCGTDCRFRLRREPHAGVHLFV